MRRLVLAALAGSTACSPVLDEADAQALEEPAPRESVAEPTIPEAKPEPAAAPRAAIPEVDTRFRCEGAIMHVARSHDANLELKRDGSFELHFGDVSDDGGRSLWMLGKWTAEPDAIVLKPESGLQRRWSGDAHRHSHGEESGYSLDQDEGVYTHERRLPITVENGRITSIRIDEIGTKVYPLRGERSERCDPTERNP